MSKEWLCWIPILRVADARQSERFYCEVLGFTKDWEHRFAKGFPLYLQLSRDPLILHLSEHEDAGQSTNLCIGVQDVDTVYAEFTSRGLRTESPPTDRDYGVRDFGFNDPDGHRLVLATRLVWFNTAQGRTQ